jgi:tRNA A37 threonylcarbamoyladenosine modification protein TsaB
MNRVLFIDTARTGAVMAIADRTPSGWKWTSKFLHPQAAGTLDFLETSMSLVQQTSPLASLGGILVNCGPGSFTGIKIGLSFVYGLTASHNIKSLPISILQGAAIAIAKRESIDRLRLVMKATSRAGYFAEICINGQDNFVGTLGKLTIDSRGQIDWITSHPETRTFDPNCKLYVLGDWMEFKLLREDVIHIGQFDSDSLALNAALVEIEGGWPNRFDAGRPAPLYLRDPAPIEK